MDSRFLKLIIRFFSIFVTISLLFSCGNYRYSSYYDNDPIYSSVDKKNNSSVGSVYKDYFDNKSKEFYQKDSIIENSTSPKGPWGSDTSRTNIYMYGGYGNPYLSYGYPYSRFNFYSPYYNYYRPFGFYGNRGYSNHIFHGYNPFYYYPSYYYFNPLFPYSYYSNFYYPYPYRNYGYVSRDYSRSYMSDNRYSKSYGNQNQRNNVVSKEESRSNNVEIRNSSIINRLNFGRRYAIPLVPDLTKNGNLNQNNSQINGTNTIGRQNPNLQQKYIRYQTRSKNPYYSNVVPHTSIPQAPSNNGRNSYNYSNQNYNSNNNYSRSYNSGSSNYSRGSNYSSGTRSSSSRSTSSRSSSSGRR